MKFAATALVCVHLAWPAALLAGDVPPPGRRAELVNMVRQDCGSCHGLTMKGGLGPALEPSAMRQKDAEQMRFVILNGRPGTPMPPWKPFLTEAEAGWIVEQLKKGLPDER
jgi:cytochrome c55X